MKRFQALAASESYAKLFEKIVIAKKKFKKWKKNMNGFVVFLLLTVSLPVKLKRVKSTKYLELGHGKMAKFHLYFG